ncbi:ABC transporter permease [Desulfonatronum sp. SC1]|uniref:ABC transporter permease n=1 Tax=Desulfonatronum sp. SC1 TaxID=2109626 RepID=UPI000D319492|nr:ABC transporter permease [Desulfonatronum sp. SC1]PTN38976.1 ABC transporter permease [Desulfonatronum sp. SC1]
MIGFLARRLLAMIPVLFGVSLLAFFALLMSPGDVATITLAAKTGIETPSQEAIEAQRRELRLDAPLHVQYVSWLGRVLTGDLGHSYLTGRPVTRELTRVFPATAALACLSLAVVLLLAVPIGVVAARHRGRPLDRAALAGSLFLSCVPDFFLGLILIVVFSISLGLTPVAGFTDMRGIILPALTLGLANAAISARLMRAGMIQALEEKHLLAAKARGLTRRVVVWKHALRQALVPLSSYVGTQFGYFFGGAVVVEVIFVWPGLGRLLVDSVNSRDIFVVQGCVLAITAIYVLINLGVDILQWILDPRTRHVEAVH